MTGMQVNPFVGETLGGDKTIQVNYKKLAEAVGIDDDNFMMVDAYKKDEVEEYPYDYIVIDIKKSEAFGGEYEY